MSPSVISTSNRARGVEPRLAAIVMAVSLAAPAAAATFEDVTLQAGVRFLHDAQSIVPIGAGAAWADVDNDGDDDLYATQAVGCNRLYLNDGDGTFTPVDSAAGAADCDGTSHGVVAGDYDNDGDQDLFISNYAQNRLFKNMLVETSSLTFQDETVAAGMGNDGDYDSGSAVWGDYDNDGYLDLFVTNHVIAIMTPVTCFPDYLWHNNGDGTFTDVGDATGVALSGVLNKAGCGLAATFSDYDNDNDPDLFVVNDYGTSNEVPNRLFRNDGPDGSGGWLFTDISDAANYDYPQAGMGIAIGDVNRDGYFDYYMTDIGNNDFARGSADGTFANIAQFLGVTANDQQIWGGRGLVSWGTAFYDLEHDGREDLIVANGGAPSSKFPFVFGGPNYTHVNPTYVYRMRWPDPSPELHVQLGVTVNRFHRGVAVSDYDDDGDVDIYLGNLQGFNTLYANRVADMNNNRWLKVRVTGTVGNRDGIGTRVRVQAGNVLHMREIDGGSSFLSRNTLTAHLGLGQIDTVDVFVLFQSGATHEFLGLPVDQTLEVTEPVAGGSFAVDDSAGTAGEAIVNDLVLTNFSAQEQTHEVWVESVAPGGTVTERIAPFVQPLQPGESITVPLSIPTDAGEEAGEHTLIARVGAYPDGIVQQDHATVQLSAP